MLRVEIARPDFHERIMIEKQEDEAADEYEEAEAPDEEEEPLIPSTKALYFPIPGRKNKVRAKALSQMCQPGKI